MLNQVRGQKVIRQTEVFFIFMNKFLNFARIRLFKTPFQGNILIHTDLFYNYLP